MQTLSLAGIPHLRSSDLAGLVSEHARVDNIDYPRLENLILSNTGIDDNVGVCLVACRRLEILNVAGTKLTGSPSLLLP